jgi:hypothetical protein
LIILSTVFGVATFAQSSANYQFNTATNASLGLTVNGDAVSFTSSANLFINNSTSATNAYVPAYDFLFMGKRYNVIVVNLDGVVGLSVDANINTMTQTVNGLNRTITYPPTTNTGPAIAPFWDDLKTAVSGRTAVGKVVGTAPYRCVVVEWNANINQNSTAAAADGVFQMRIYESTGKIEFVYGKMQVGSPSGTVTASIGFAGGNANNTVMAIKDLSTFATTTLTIEEAASRSLVNTSVAGPITALNSAADGSRRVFTFTPPVCNGAFTSGVVNNVAATRMQLNWSDNITNKLGYLVYRSAVDSNNYQFVTTLAASATNYTATNLNVNTRYYWKVIPYTEGNTETVLRVTDSTRCTMAGNYTIGSGGSFASLKAAKDSLATWGIVGNTVWELLPTYSFATETAPVTMKLPPCYLNNSTVTIRPAAGNSVNYLHAGNNPILLLDSTSNVIIDGRAGGAGASSMIIAGAGELIKIRNGWNNTLQHLDIRSTATATAYTAVTVEATTGGGAHDNVIANCSIHDSTGNPAPPQLLFSKQTGAAINAYNTVQNCNFYNFTRYAAVIEGKGWQLLNNNFYATIPITAQDSCGFLQLKYVDNSDSSHVVTGNYFGGSAPMATGNQMLMKSPVFFAGLYAYSKARISNNTFKRISVEVLNNPGFYYNYYSRVMQLGVVDGTTYGSQFVVTNNAFGAEQPGDSIYIINSTTTSYTPLYSSIVSCAQYGNNTFTNNTFVNIRTSVPAPNQEHHLGILEAGYGSIQNNIIGSDIPAYRILHRGTGDLNGIVSGAPGTINNNIITSIAGTGRTTGIFSGATGTQISNNKITHLRTFNGATNFYALCGIASFSGGNSVTGNTIYNLMDSAVGSSYGVMGIFDRNSGSNISGNFIDALTGNSSVLGIQLYDVSSQVNNNMIRLGVDTAGNPVNSGGFYGLFSNFGGTIIHNTFYIAGGLINQTTGIGGATAIYTHPSATIMNNIFVHKRTYSGLMGATVLGQLPGYAYSGFDHNIYHFSPGVKFAGYYTSLQQYQQTESKEFNSMQIDPSLVAPDGPTRLLNMHIQDRSAAEQRGFNVPGYTTSTDFDGDIRAANTPTDIGADAGQYQKLDLEPPRFIVTPLADATDTTSRSIVIRITDSTSGVRDTGALRPMIWYRKNYPVVTAWQSAYGTRVSGTIKDGLWQFNINHQLLNVSVNGNDSIQYYFVAQDTALPQYFVGTGPAGGVHTSVTQQVSPPATPFIYRIYISGYIIPSVVTIAPDQRYTTLTGDGGLFEGIARDSIHASVTTITAKIGAYLSESGKWSLDSVITRKNIRLNIVPAYDSLFIISNSGNLSTDMIRLNNADRVTIDGSFNGTGRWLRFVNTHTTAASAKSTIALMKNTDSLILKNCELMNNTSNFFNSGIILIHDGTSTDVEIRNNILSNVPGNATKPCAGIQGTLTGIAKRLVVAENHFVNMNKAGVHFNYYSYNSRLDSNHVYWNAPTPHTSGDFNAFYTGGGVVTTHQIKGNYIGGSQPYALGTPWVNSSVLSQFVFIKVLTGGDAYSLVENNVIRNFSATNVNGSTFIGINVTGAGIINGNMVGDSTVNNSLQFAGTNFTMISASSRKQIVSNNFVGGINLTNNTWAAPFVAIWCTGDSAVTISKNIVRNINSASEASGSSSGTFSGIYSFPGATVEQNTISNITLTGATNIQFYGIHLLSKKGWVSRNRIYNINMPNSVNGILAGVTLIGGSWKIWNNQFTLTNGTNTNALNIYGIHDKTSGSTDTKDIAFNTFLIGGSQASGSASSYGLNGEGNATTVRFRNNLVVNNRSGGTGVHGMVAVKKTTPANYWPASAGNYNLYVTKDTANAFLWGTSTVLGMGSWRSNTSGDANSYITPAPVLPAGQLFADSANGNLNIDTTKSICWYLNGKGNPVDSIDADFNQTGTRSTNVSNGPVDIGSHEFTTSAIPPNVYVYGRHQLGGSDTLSFNGRIVAVINWNNTGTLPTLGNAQWYSGVWPNDTTNGGTVTNARFTSSYLHLPATGGSGYSYSLVYYYDSSMMGKVPNAANLVVNKRQPGVLGSWQNLPSTVNLAAKTITVNNQVGFSEFTAADVMSPLPMHLLNFTGAGVEKDVQLGWQIVPADEELFIVERSFNGSAFSGVINTKATGAVVYNAVDYNVIQQATGVLYYRLKMISKTGEVQYSKVITIKPGVTRFVMNVAPNPFTNSISVQLKLDHAAALRCSLVDLDGRVVYLRTINGARGLQSITLDGVNGLARGSYVLQVTSGELRYEAMLLKL